MEDAGDDSPEEGEGQSSGGGGVERDGSGGSVHDRGRRVAGGRVGRSGGRSHASHVEHRDTDERGDEESLHSFLSDGHNQLQKGTMKLGSFLRFIYLFLPQIWVF